MHSRHNKANQHGWPKASQFLPKDAKIPPLLSTSYLQRYKLYLYIHTHSIMHNNPLSFAVDVHAGARSNAGLGDNIQPLEMFLFRDLF